MIKIHVVPGVPIFTLEPAFYQQLKSRIVDNLNNLPLDVCLKSEDIYGAGGWAELTPGTRKKIGRYIAIMVDSDDIPFRCVPKKHEYPKLYVRK